MSLFGAAWTTGLDYRIAPRWKPPGDNLCAIPQRIEMIRPMLHHLDPFIPALTTSIGATDASFLMRELAFNRVADQVPISLSNVAAIARNPCAVICPWL